MNRPLTLVVALAVGLSACKRAAPKGVDLTPTKEIVVGVEMIDYDDEQGAYTCPPRFWGIHEDNGATFIGPRDPKRRVVPTSPSCGIREVQPDGATPRKYAESFWQVDPQNKQPALEKGRSATRP